jgi:hypothetical protein
MSWHGVRMHVAVAAFLCVSLLPCLLLLLLLAASGGENFIDMARWAGVQ